MRGRGFGMIVRAGVVLLPGDPLRELHRSPGGEGASAAEPGLQTRLSEKPGECEIDQKEASVEPATGAPTASRPDPDFHVSSAGSAEEQSPRKSQSHV
jgi:hypothetical protein